MKKQRRHENKRYRLERIAPVFSKLRWFGFELQAFGWLIYRFLQSTWRRGPAFFKITSLWSISILAALAFFPSPAEVPPIFVPLAMGASLSVTLMLYPFAIALTDKVLLHHSHS